MSKGITIENVTFEYLPNIPILKNISLAIEPGIFLGIIGSNGCGKSTLLQLLNGLIPNLTHGRLKGEVLIDGISTRKEKVTYFAKKVGMLFQNPDFSLFNLTVREEIEFGLKNFNILNSDLRINEVLKTVNLEHFENRDPQTLSLGEKQKVCLAAILALDTQYIVLDEPVAMLDYKSSQEIYQILNNLKQAGKTIITVEHDTDFLWHHATDVLALQDGAVVAYGKKEQILKDRELLIRLGLKVPNYLE